MAPRNAAAKPEDPQTAELKRKNRIALLSLLAGKLLGIAGVILTFSDYRSVGGAMIALAFVFVGVSVFVAIGSFRRQRQEELSDLAVLEKMVRGGTLKDHLRDVEQKLRAEHEEHTREIDRNSGS